MTLLAWCDGQQWLNRIQHGASGSWGRSGAYRGGWNGGWGGNLNGGLSGGAWTGAYTGGRSWGQPTYATGIGNRGPIGQPVAAYAGGALPARIAIQPQPNYGARYEDESPKPYSFGYNTVDEYGTQLGRQEVADGNGNVRGSYSYRDPNGQFRQVQYVADQAGFRAEVDTNEHGVVSHRPADAVYNVHQ